MSKIKFIRWVKKDTKYIWAEVEYMGRKYYVPLSRLIPTPACEADLRAKGIKDPNRIAMICAERNSFFGPAVVRHITHEELSGVKFEFKKARPFPPNIDFSCVRDEILRGTPTDEAIKKCTLPQKF